MEHGDQLISLQTRLKSIDALYFFATAFISYSVENILIKSKKPQ